MSLTQTAHSKAAAGVAAFSFLAMPDNATVILGALIGSVYYITHGSADTGWRKFAAFCVCFGAGVLCSKEASEILTSLTSKDVNVGIGALVASVLANKALGVISGLDLKHLLGGSNGS